MGIRCSQLLGAQDGDPELLGKLQAVLMLKVIILACLFPGLMLLSVCDERAGAQQHLELIESNLARYSCVVAWL